jgi:hypothetical protein
VPLPTTFQALMLTGVFWIVTLYIFVEDYIACTLFMTSLFLPSNSSNCSLLARRRRVVCAVSVLARFGRTTPAPISHPVVRGRAGHPVRAQSTAARPDRCS